MGGLFGVLLGNEEVQEVRIHGPQKIKYFLEIVRPCADSDFGGSQAQPFMLEERTFEKVKYEDAALTAYYIPVFAMNSKSGLSESMVNCDTAYLIELKVSLFSK
jgi:hypothetical protein